MASLNRFHVRIGKRRTNVSMDATLAALLAVKLNAKEDDEHGAVRAWCQTQIDADEGAYVYGRVSQRLAELATLEVAAPLLKKAFWERESARQERRRRARR
jgi:hypothetical protein